jgi:hypothetical protein
MAHLRIQGVDVAVFAADARSHLDRDRAELLADYTVETRQLGLHVQKSALAFREYGRTKYFGTPDLVRYLANNGVSRWTHRLRVR